MASGYDGRLLLSSNWARKSLGERSESRAREENEGFGDRSWSRDRGVSRGLALLSGDCSRAFLDVGGRSDARRLVPVLVSSVDGMRLALGVVESDCTGDDFAADGNDCRLLARAMRDCGG